MRYLIVVMTLFSCSKKDIMPYFFKADNKVIGDSIIFFGCSCPSGSYTMDTAEYRSIWIEHVNTIIE